MSEQEPNHKHYINGLTGEKFQQMMIEQVNEDNWKTGLIIIHHFYSFPESSQTQGPDETVDLNIELNPTYN